jgi:hypothetical protein
VPDIPGRMKSEGYISPAPPEGAPKEIKIFMAKTYGGLRKHKFPGENKENKMRSARITWYQTKRKFGKKYPELFKKSGKNPGRKLGRRTKSSLERQIERGARIEHKEHPEFTKAQARQIAMDHINKDPTEYSTKKVKTPGFSVPYIIPASTKEGRKQQVKDIRSAAKEQRKWAKEAKDEGTTESKRAKHFEEKGMPIHGAVLKADSELAMGFKKNRCEVAKNLDLQAARIAAMRGD